MKNNRDDMKLLLDTSFLLPSLGIEIKATSKILRNLAKTQAELYYSRFSILESLWVLARTLQKRDADLEVFATGLRGITEGPRYREVREDYQVFSHALRLRQLGHYDIIDNILYAASVQLGLKFLTFDAELIEFVRARRLNDVFIAPSSVAD